MPDPDGEDVAAADGQADAMLMALSHRLRWIPRADFAERFSGRQTDAAFGSELAELTGETTDDLPL